LVHGATVSFGAAGTPVDRDDGPNLEGVSMQFRFVKVVALLCVLAGAFAGAALALDFDDEDPQPVVGEVGREMDYVIGTHAGCLPHRLEIESGGLPPGTTLTKIHSRDDDVLRDHSTFEVTGVPTQAGTFSAWLALRDCDNRSAETLFVFDIGQRTYSIRTTSLPAATLGRAYRAKLEAGGHPIRSETWVIVAGALPSGLTLGRDGTISGTPTAAGAGTFTVKATSVGDDDAIRIDTKQLTVDVTVRLAIASRSLPPATRGRAYRAAIAITGGVAPFRWSVTGLPRGLTFAASTGTISGRPRAKGSYRVRLRVRDSLGVAAAKTLTLRVR
jgi:hypothetical protein